MYFSLETETDDYKPMYLVINNAIIKNLEFSIIHVKKKGELACETERKTVTHLRNRKPWRAGLWLLPRGCKARKSERPRHTHTPAARINRTRPPRGLPKPALRQFHSLLKAKISASGFYLKVQDQKLLRKNRGDFPDRVTETWASRLVLPERPPERKSLNRKPRAERKPPGPARPAPSPWRAPVAPRTAPSAAGWSARRPTSGDGPRLSWSQGNVLWSQECPWKEDDNSLPCLRAWSQQTCKECRFISHHQWNRLLLTSNKNSIKALLLFSLKNLGTVIGFRILNAASVKQNYSSGEQVQFQQKSRVTVSEFQSVRIPWFCDCDPKAVSLPPRPPGWGETRLRRPHPVTCQKSDWEMTIKLTYSFIET